MHVDWLAVIPYVKTNWKLYASLGLTAAAALNGAFGVVSPATATTIGLFAGALGIGLHHKGDPLPAKPGASK